MKKIPYLLALLPMIFLIGLIALNISLFEDTLNGPNQLTLLFSGAVAAIIGILYGNNWKDILEGISKSIKSVIPSIIILLLIGSLAGTWLISGIVPAMIYYGLQILNPEIFLFATAIITAIVSLATGSSWSTIATIGIALLGIGQALGLGAGIVGGAIISGAYFGDKMSPLSDTTNLAPAMAGTDLFTHIKYMMYTTIPSFSIALILFLVLGFQIEGTSSQNTDELLNVLYSSFNITPLLFLVSNNKHFGAKNKTFKDFMEGKIKQLKNKRPSNKDLQIHLSTIFTEVRLKQYLEIRSLDTCEWNCHCAGPAFYLGLLYENLDASLDVIKNWNVTEVLNAYKDAPKKGLNTLMKNKSLLEWGKIFLKLSEEGLHKRSIKNTKDIDEAIFLSSIKNILMNNKTKAEIAIESFKNKKLFDFLYEKN